MNLKHVGEFSDHSRMIRPSARCLHKTCRKIKDIVRIVSREQLRLNRIEHSKDQCEAAGKPCDVEHIDEDGNKHYYIGIPVCRDGAGSTRE